MFYKLAISNIRRNIQDYFIYFATLVVAIASFYIVLAVRTQDVFLFLEQMDSYSVEAVYKGIDIVFLFSLAAMFFLILYANSYLMVRRRREFGLYLILGMRQGDLYRLLLIEGLLFGVAALAVGLPIGVFTSELISLISARLFGTDLLSHRFQISWRGVFLASLSFYLIQVLTVVVTSAPIYRYEIQQLLYPMQKAPKPNENRRLSPLLFAGSAVVLLIAYAFVLKVNLLDWVGGRNGYYQFFILCLIGSLCVFGLFRSGFSLYAAWKRKRRGEYFGGLTAYRLRQSEGQFISRYKSLGIVSLLLFLAIALNSMDLVVYNNRNYEEPAFDMSLISYDSENMKEMMESGVFAPYMKETVSFDLGYASSGSIDSADYEAVRSQLEMDGTISAADLSNFEAFFGPNARFHILKQSEFESVLSGKKLNLAPDEYAFYTSTRGDSLRGLVEELVKVKPRIFIQDQSYKSDGSLQDEPITVEGAYYVAMAVILPDAEFEKFRDAEDMSWETTISFHWLNREQTGMGQLETATMMKKLLRDYNDQKRGQILAAYKEATQIEKERLEARYGVYQPSPEGEVEMPDTIQGIFGLEIVARRVIILVGVVYTLMYLGIIFVLVGASLLALQQITEHRNALGDYEILRKLGATPTQVKETVKYRTKIYFWAAMGFAILNASVAMRAFYSIIVREAQKVSITWMLIPSICILSIYGIYYFYTLKMGYREIDRIEW